MGESEYLSVSQVELLETATMVLKEAQPWTQEPGNIDLAVALRPQSVTAVTIRIRLTLKLVTVYQS
jgi:hypothetical protein